MEQIDFRALIPWVLVWLIGYGLGLLEGWIKEKRRGKNEPEIDLFHIKPL